MMTHLIYFCVLFLVFLNLHNAWKSDDPLEGTSSVCADVCTPSEAHVELDLSEARINRENERVQITLHHTGSGRCREPALIKIPLEKIGKHGIVKFDLDFGPVLHNYSIDIGFNNEDNQTIQNVNIFNQQVSIEYRSNDRNQTDIFQQSVTLLEPGEHLTIYISNEWIQIENNQRNHEKLVVYFNESNFLMHQNPSYKDLLVGLNRNINGNHTGIGLCLVNLTFIECLADQQSALNIDVNKKTFEQHDLENINWISHLTYLDPNADIRDCTAQGVVRLTFDPNGTKRIARFDLSMGSQVQGFTFNIGDSATNNGYGGDGGTTSNSAEIHSNDNRFYIWANTKICGDTLLLKIDYNVIEPFDNITIFVSNERIELTNHRSYHQILQSPYLYALDRQNVTCNCFDSLCYPGVQPDNDVYFGINRVIGGTYRPGTEVSPRIKYESTTTTQPTTTTTTEETTVLTSTESINITNKLTEHGKEMISTTESSTFKMEEVNTTIVDHSTNTFLMNFVENITSTESKFDDMTTYQKFNEEENHFANVSIINNEEESSTTTTTHPPLFHLLANLSQHITTENPISKSTFQNFNSTTIENHTISLLTNVNPCTLENLRANFVYHEYPLDKHKFIFCDNEGKMNIIACSPNYIWSQNEQSCILPN